MTICTVNRACLFGEVIEGKMRPNETGKIVAEQWRNMPQRFPRQFVVMSNHVHLVFFIVDVPPSTDRAAARAAPTVGEIVGAYKSLCVHHRLAWVRQHDPGRVLGALWQRNYFEHVIRDEDALADIREYVFNNPQQWALDRENPANAGNG